MSIFTNSGTEHCGVRLQGRIRNIVPDQAQLCAPQPRGRPNRDQEFAEERTDECGQPLPYSCVAQQMMYPTCYVNPNAPSPYETTVLPGFKQLTIASGCNVTTVVILDLQLAPVVGAIEFVCGDRSSLPGQPG